MKTLREPDEYITRYLGTQKEEYGIKYKLNPYIVEYENVIYNAFTGEVIKLETGDTNDELIRRWYLVPDSHDVRTLVDTAYRNRRWASYKQKSLSKELYVIFTTTACNASCKYCFENDYKHVSMSEKTANDVADYIISTRNKDKKVRIKWFGGEPLVNKKAISVICDKIHNAGVPFLSIMSTNGYLLDKCSDEEIKSWELSYIQFTIDAAGENYSVYKGLPSDAYEKLKESAKRLSDLGVKIQLRVHYSPFLGFDVCKEIIDDFKDIPNLSMYSRILYGLATPERYEELMRVEDYIEKNHKMKFGFPRKDAVFHCMADNPSIATITPDGGLSSCEHYPYGDNIYGTIYTKDVNQKKLDEWSIKEKYQNPKCSECPIYPVCKKIVSCPAEDSCDNGYRDYKINYIKRALRKKVKELGYQNN